MSVRVRILLSLLPIVIGIDGVQAQPIWTDKASARGITLDYISPILDNQDVGSATSLTFLTARIPVSKTARLKGEIPVGYFSRSSGSMSSEFVFGNPYIGIEVLGSDRSSTAEFGIRIPTIYNETPLSGVAVAADFDRFEAFAEETLAITGIFVGRKRSSKAFQMEMTGGLTYLVPFSDGTALWGRYAGQLYFTVRPISVIAGITGRAQITGTEGNFGERSVHQFGLSFVAEIGNVRPGIMVRVPLDQTLKDTIDAIIGANLSYEIR